eukprot:TRINITY_DN1125_c0_g1_i4.p1 TRINITY_DN1125_c0_g1~~TRINITY_DN1125_c0_g1_i4.p1  ORF type:complete len:579 (-),score=119.79 TRINITY_DN1125_c0_g1_i4:608-2344(-)
MMHSNWDAVFPLMDTFHTKIRAFSHVHDVALVHADLISHLQNHTEHLTEQCLEDIRNLFLQSVERINSRSDSELFAKVVIVMNRSSSLFDNTHGSDSLSMVLEAIVRVWPNASLEHRNTLLHVGVEIIETFLSREFDQKHQKSINCPSAKPHHSDRDVVLSYIGSLCSLIWKEINYDYVLTSSSPATFLDKMPLIVKMWKYGFSMDGVDMKAFENVGYLRVIFDYLLRIAEDPASADNMLICAVDIVHSAQNRALLIGMTRMFNAGLFSLIKNIARKKSLLLGFKIFSSWNGLLRMIQDEQDVTAKLRGSVSLEMDDVNCLLSQLRYTTMEKKSPVVAHKVLEVIAAYTADYGHHFIRSSLLDILRSLDQSVEERTPVAVELVLLARALIYECVETKDFTKDDQIIDLTIEHDGTTAFEESKIELQKHSKCPSSIEPTSHLTDLLKRLALATKEAVVDDLRRRIIAVSVVHAVWTRDSVEFLLRCIRSEKLLVWKHSSLLALASISKHPIGAAIIDIGIGGLFSHAMSPFPAQHRLLVSYILQNILKFSKGEDVLKKLRDISSRKSHSYRFVTSVPPF